MKERKSRIQNKNSIILNNNEAFDYIKSNRANENLEEIAKKEDENINN